MRSPKVYGTGERVILSVEDDEAAYRLLELGFDEVGGDYRLFRVLDGAQALAFLRRSGDYANAPRPDLMLLNLNLPRVNGFDVLKAIKNDPTRADVPSVVFSSSRMPMDKARCLAMGAREFLTKPSEFGEFLNVLRHVCSLV